MQSIWNLTSPLRSGLTNMSLLGSGRELYGTVLKSGLNDKTVTVRVDYQFYLKRYKTYKYGISKFLVHDEENFCVEGDKVVIKTCLPISSRKHYFVRNIIKPFPRQDFYQNQTENPLYDQEYKRLYTTFLEKEIERSPPRNKKIEHKVKTQVKAKAMAKAIQNLKKLENEKKKDSKVNFSNENKEDQKE